MQKNGVDSSTLTKLGPSKDSTAAGSAANEPLKDMEEFARDFRMLRMECPNEAVTQLIMDGIHPVILVMCTESISDVVEDRIRMQQV
ncbi:hypothetical protein PsorP6_010065 [Peronosclerospora sorghi]|uniref:Uncharacterized protein n=1 Tax=Peronosclerospora sorghi TaxID=230839 RepID=A0ACC0VVS1_9STRA|nr:hypothetical protein PsorP6_010065 [Peronosclerospora sorghi]